MKRITSLLFTLFLFHGIFLFHLSCTAQTAQQVMDQTAALLKKAGGIQANFTATTYKGTQATGSTGGKIAIQGKKFKVNSGQATIWFNGTTQWTLSSRGDEVYVATPTAAELQSMNPYAFVDLYKSGYSMTLTETTYKGKACHEVSLIATNKSAAIGRMLVTIDKTTHRPLCIRLKPTGKEWVRLQISDITTKQKFAASYFEYSPAQHPGIQLIDLR